MRMTLNQRLNEASDCNYSLRRENAELRSLLKFCHTALNAGAHYKIDADTGEHSIVSKWAMLKDAPKKNRIEEIINNIGEK